MKKLLSIGLLAFSCVSYPMDQIFRYFDEKLLILASKLYAGSNIDEVRATLQNIEVLPEIKKAAKEFNDGEKSNEVDQKSAEYIKGQGWDAQEYEKNSDPQFEAALELIKAKIKNLESVERIVDLGCGTGKLAVRLAEMAPKSTVVGMDLSQAMIEKARTSTRYFDRVTFLEWDIQNFWRAIPPVQLIVSFACFHFLKNHDEALKNVASSLARNGEFLLTMAAKNEDSILAKAFSRTINNSVWETFKPVLLENFKKTLTRDELLKKMQDAGLWVNSVDEDMRNIKFATREKFSAFMQAWAKGIEGIEQMGASQQSEFIESVINNYLEFKPADDAGKITYSFPVLIAHASNMDLGFLGSV